MPSPDTPIFAHPAAHLIPVSAHLSQLMEIPPSRMFLIKKSLAEFQKNHPGEQVYDASQGDGGASLGGVPPEILQLAAEKQIKQGTAYDMPYGTAAFRRSVLENYWQVDASLGLAPENVVAAAGGRDGLAKAYTAMLSLGHGRQGDLLLVSRVPWVSYNWGPYALGANVLHAPGSPDDGWGYTEAGIQASVAFARRHGREIAGIIITSPDNPTGRTLSARQQIELARCALRAGIAYVLFDWIYHYITDEAPININEILGAVTPDERARVIILDGITKSLGGSSIRNAHLIASRPVADFIVAHASHTVIPSFFSMAVAQTAYETGFERAAEAINGPTSASRKILREFLSANGFRHIIGQGYYAFIHLRDVLTHAGWADTEPLSEYFGRQHGLAVVPGVYCSDEGAAWIRFSYALPPESTTAALHRLEEGLAALKSQPAAG